VRRVGEAAERKGVAGEGVALFIGEAGEARGEEREESGAKEKGEKSYSQDSPAAVLREAVEAQFDAAAPGAGEGRVAAGETDEEEDGEGFDNVESVLDHAGDDQPQELVGHSELCPAP
jgi:hypothetical protein